jgi:anthranilate phosphoribosyltransferase
MSFDATPYLREIARGQRAARDLTREQARMLFAAIFAGEVADLALGALLVAFRVKGESADELAGMMDALGAHVRPLRLPPSAQGAAVMLPTYNGARKLPNLVPLLALLLAREGICVVVHAAQQEAQRVGTFEILSLLGHAPAATLGEAEHALESMRLAAVPIALLSPALARLIDARLVTGVRNTGHTLAKLVLPAGVAPRDAARLVAVTHPDFQSLLREYFTRAPANVFLLRGVEGEAVVRLHAPQPIEHLGLDGGVRTLVIESGEPTTLPARDAHATAQWTASVLEGRTAAPPAIARQAEAIAARCRAGASEMPQEIEQHVRG